MNFVSDENFRAAVRSKTDYFNGVGELTEDEAVALVKVVRHESGKTKNYIREQSLGENRGGFVDPSSMKLSSYNMKTRDAEDFPFRSVSDKSVVYYLEFLKKKQPSYLRMAEREKDV